MAIDTYKSYRGRGKAHLRLSGTTSAFRHVGNVSSIVLKHQMQTDRQQDFTRMGGGSLKRVDTLNQIDMDMEWLSFNTANLLLALGGASSSVTTGTVTNEAVTAYKDSFVPLAFLPQSIASVIGSGAAAFQATIAGTVMTVTSMTSGTITTGLAVAGTGVTAGSVIVPGGTGSGGTGTYNLSVASTVASATAMTATGPTYTAGTDYDMSPAGLWVYSGGGIADAQALKVSYTKAAYDDVQANVVTGSPVVQFLFEGLNDAENGDAVVLEAWRVQIPPSADITLLADAMTSLKFTAEVLRDSSKPAGISGFYHVRKF